MNEPSEHAKRAAVAITHHDGWNSLWLLDQIQSAIDAATAEKDARIAELEKALRYPRYETTALLMEHAADLIERLQKDSPGRSYFIPHLRNAAEDMRQALNQRKEGDETLATQSSEPATTPVTKTDIADAAQSVVACNAAREQSEPLSDAATLPPSCGPASTLDNKTLVQVLIEVYARSGMYGTKVLHDRWVECRAEVLRRLSQVASEGAPKPWQIEDEHGVKFTPTSVSVPAASSLPTPRREHLVKSAGYWFGASRIASDNAAHAHATFCMENAYNHVENALAAAQRELAEFRKERDEARRERDEAVNLRSLMQDYEEEAAAIAKLVGAPTLKEAFDVMLRTKQQDETKIEEMHNRIKELGAKLADAEKERDAQQDRAIIEESTVRVLRTQIADLTKRLDVAREDTKRLDWLEAHWADLRLTSPDMSNKNWKVTIYPKDEARRYERHLTLRAAIDAAMKDSK